MYFPIASGVWSFCHEVVKKYSEHCSPASSCGPALVPIIRTFSRVTTGATARMTLDQMKTATTAARSPTRTARVIVRTGSLLLVRLAAVPKEHGPGTSGAILADAPGESPGAPVLAPALSARPAR